MCCDFVRDELGNLFFTNCKGFRVHDYETIAQVSGLPLEL